MKRIFTLITAGICLSGCGYIYSTEEVDQMTSELARLSGQNGALVDEVTRLETELSSLRQAVGIQGGAMMMPSAVTDPIQQIVLADLPKQTALIPVTDDGTGLIYTVSSAVFFGDDQLYVYAQGENVGIDMILTYQVKNDGLNTVDWKAEMYSLGDGWIPITPNAPVLSIVNKNKDTASSQSEEASSSEPELDPSAAANAQQEAASASSEEASASMSAEESSQGTGTSSSAVESASSSEESATSVSSSEAASFPFPSGTDIGASSQNETSRSNYMDIING